MPPWAGVSTTKPGALGPGVARAKPGGAPRARGEIWAGVSATKPEEEDAGLRLGSSGLALNCGTAGGGTAGGGTGPRGGTGGCGTGGGCAAGGHTAGGGGCAGSPSIRLPTNGGTAEKVCVGRLFGSGHGTYSSRSLVTSRGTCKRCKLLNLRDKPHPPATLCVEKHCYAPVPPHQRKRNRNACQRHELINVLMSNLLLWAAPLALAATPRALDPTRPCAPRQRWEASS